MSDIFNFISEFLIESESQITEIRRNLPVFIGSLENGETPSFEKNSKILRAVHSINGGSSFAGLSDIESVAAKLERMIYHSVSGKIKSDKNLAEIIEKTFSVLESGLKSRGKIKKKEWSKIEKEIERLVFVTTDDASGMSEHEVTVSLDGKDTVFTVNDPDMLEKLEKRNLYVIKFDAASDISEDEISLIQMVTVLTKEGDIIDSIIEIDSVEEETIPISILYMSHLTLSKMKNLLSFLPEKAVKKIDRKIIDAAFSKDSEETDTVFEKNLEKQALSEQPDTPEEILKVTVTEKETDIEETEEVLTNKYVSFKIGTEHYAVPIEYVYDMKEMLPCSRIPNQPDHFLGVANLRGNVVPVVDLRKVFGLNDVKYDQFTVFLMLKLDNKIKGCVVDSIDDVVFLEPENTQIAPVLSRKIKTDFVKFIAKEPKSERFLIVIDVEKMLENE